MAYSCTDGLTDEARSVFLNRTVKISDNIKYFQEQIVGLNDELLNLNNSKHTLHPDVYNRQYNAITEAIAQDNTNLASEQKMLDILNRKANEGNLSTEVPSSLSKRSFEGSQGGR